MTDVHSRNDRRVLGPELRGALLEGHFRLSSGLHSGGFLQCALVLQYPERAAAFGDALADKVRHLEATTVLSPALGGLVIGHEVARALGVRALFAERRDDRFSLRRGFRLDDDDRVLVVEDVVTTGGSTRATVAVASEAGANVVGAAAIINRGGPGVDLGVPLSVLAELTWPTSEPDVCPMCNQGLPLTVPGSRPKA